MALTPLRSRFVDEYLVDTNATQAAIRAGFSARTAKATGSKLLKDPEIAAAIAAAEKARSVKVGLQAEDVLKALMEIAFLDPADIFTPEGTLKPLDQIPREARRAIVGLEVETLYDTVDGVRQPVGQLRKVKLADKVRALEDLAKHLGLLREKLEVSADASFAEILKAARERGARR